MTTEKPTTKVVKTANDLGYSMPIGVSDRNGILHKEFAFKKWRLKEEKEIGELKKEMDEAKITQYISAILCTMCTRIGSNDFTALEDVQKRIILSQMYAADVFYIYTMLRKENVGEFLEIEEIACPHCTKRMPFKGDIGTVDVTCVDRVEDLIWEYELKEPIEIRGKETKKLKLSTVKWHVYESLKEEHLNEAMAEEFMLLNIVVGSDVVPENLILQSGDLDELGKKDFEILTEDLMPKNTPGPTMVIEATCNRSMCKKKIYIRLPWERESFFGISSQ